LSIAGDAVVGCKGPILNIVEISYPCPNGTLAADVAVVLVVDPVTHFMRCSIRFGSADQGSDRPVFVTIDWDWTDWVDPRRESGKDWDVAILGSMTGLSSISSPSVDRLGRDGWSFENGLGLAMGH
jgi:hypothetical protein